MTADIRLLVLDIDGTLAGHSNLITERVLDRVQAVQARGIKVAIATGRMYRSALRFHEMVQSTLPLLAYQGAFIKDPRSQKLLRHSPLPRNLALEILTHLAPLEAQSALSIHLYIDDALHVRAVIDDTVAYAARSGVEPIAAGDLHQLLHQNGTLETTKLLALSTDTALIADLLSKLGQQYAPEEVYLTRSVDTFFEATHPHANKGAAVRYLAEELLDLRADQVMTIGDNFNDLEMIQYAGIGVAMGDAPQPVKDAADWVAPGVEVDGVADAIEHFLL
ncbi:Cof-type HAD-IIB family hydrolase [Pseudanabaena sp. FACHB-2040]|uniref:Cof-type HAD-IIB family hydrolase n=1 Tax=Pseudanabaena sp. FACHB-2040 TaxID=2692859 RepID=UPI00168A24F1|nr:Cof-type HAD-IIB family hydrolase [Pseudanabaena sp. FACHB-2040]MBD2256041.1 HAD family phosphatase [Pseudanabaena sp. FACHB-2040]